MKFSTYPSEILSFYDAINIFQQKEEVVKKLNKNCACIALSLALPLLLTESEVLEAAIPLIHDAEYRYHRSPEWRKVGC